MLDAKDALAAALRLALPFLPGVLAVDVGLRQDGIELTDELAIRVMVADSEQIPPGLSDYLNDVAFPAAIIERDPTPLIDNTAHDPMHGEITIRAAHGVLLIPWGAGKLGGFATDTMFGGMVGVTCAHVIAESDQEVHQGGPIFQPDRSIGSSDDKPNRHRRLRRRRRLRNRHEVPQVLFRPPRGAHLKEPPKFLARFSSRQPTPSATCYGCGGGSDEPRRHSGDI